jgi:hypothetical protein
MSVIESLCSSAARDPQAHHRQCLAQTYGDKNVPLHMTNFDAFMNNRESWHIYLPE